MYSSAALVQESLSDAESAVPFLFRIVLPPQSTTQRFFEVHVSKTTTKFEFTSVLRRGILLTG
jgi:hypothetical protein